jgi:3-dehydroquinate dehydratase type I
VAVVSDEFKAIENVAPLVDIFELRIDLIGGDWREIVRHLKKPWIACNRRKEEGGSWQGSESGRIAELLSAVELGASIIDVELATSGIDAVVKELKGRVDCLLSYHDLETTPSTESMKDTIRRQLDTGADICKVVTTARNIADNMAVLQLIADFPAEKVISFAMGPLGYLSRVLCLPAGGYLTYAAIEAGSESAPGQLTAGDLRKIYGLMHFGNS